MAYSTKCPLHLLNVRAASMSAFPDDADHFLRWLERTRPGQFGACSFVPRSVYGEYIRSVLEDAVRGTSSKFRHLRTRAIAARVAPAGIAIETEDSGLVHGDALILATGNAAPGGWPGLSPEIAASGRYFNLAWTEGAFDLRDHDSPVLLLGSGPTAVDALLALRHQGHHGQVYMVSRRGLLPQATCCPSTTACPRRRSRACEVSCAICALRRHKPPLSRLPGGKSWIPYVPKPTGSGRPSVAKSKGEAGTSGRFGIRTATAWRRDRRGGPRFPSRWQPPRNRRENSRLSTAPGLRRSSIALRGRAATRRLQVHRIVNCTGSGAESAVRRIPCCAI